MKFFLTHSLSCGRATCLYRLVDTGFTGGTLQFHVCRAYAWRRPAVCMPQLLQYHEDATSKVPWRRSDCILELEYDSLLARTSGEPKYADKLTEQLPQQYWMVPVMAFTQL